jgi:hypothetical protein
VIAIYGTFADTVQGFLEIAVGRSIPMTLRRLAVEIKKLKVRQPVTATYEQSLIAGEIWSRDRVWYKSQKEHWLGWLSEYNGPGAYNRKTWNGRSAEFVYNHIGCPPMLLWLAEAAGVSKSRVVAAKRSALASQGNLVTHCAVLRRVIPWPLIEEHLQNSRLTKRLMSESPSPDLASQDD